jgi:hypothetical protein
MNGINWTIAAYAVGLTLLWGYAVVLWLEGRSLARRGGARNTARRVS